MKAELWTLNALAVELARDRRSLARDLDDLEPDAEETDTAGRTTRRYRMARVFSHLMGNGEFDDQRERLAAAQAEKVETENAVRRGELAVMSDVQRVWADHIAAARAKLLAIPAKLAPQITGIHEPNVIAAAVRAEVTAALAELAEYEAPPGPDEGNGMAPVEAAPEPDGEPVGGRRAAAQ